MSEKVLKGFYKKDAKLTKTLFGYEVESNYKIYESNLVPVRLASESVDLKWLRGEIENFYYCNPEMEGANMALKHLLSIAEKEAKKK